MIKFSKVRDVKSPERAHHNDAGLDFYIPNDWNNGEIKHLGFGDNVLIPAGIKMNLSNDVMMRFDNKSGISVKKGLILGACIIDSPYQGELHINLIKATHGVIDIKPGMKIAQGIFYSINYFNPIEVDIVELFDEKSARGEGGFGSTGE